MLHEPTEQFRPASTQSRVAFLVGEYERWYALYNQVSDQLEALPLDDVEGRKPLDVAEAQAVRLMGQITEELAVTRARSLRDLGLKARVAQRDDTPLAAALMIELMEVNDLPPIERYDFKPRQVLPSFQEPVTQAEPTIEKCRLLAQPEPACPVENLGRRFQKAVENFDILDGSAEAKRAEMLISALSEAAVLSQTKSPMGALCQLAQIVGDVGVILDLADFGEHKEEIRHRAMRFDVGTWSIRRFLESHFQIDAREVGADYYMPERTSFEGSIEQWASARLQQAAE